MGPGEEAGMAARGLSRRPRQGDGGLDCSGHEMEDDENESTFVEK